MEKKEKIQASLCQQNTSFFLICIIHTYYDNNKNYSDKYIQIFILIQLQNIQNTKLEFGLGKIQKIIIDVYLQKQLCMSDRNM